MLLRQIYLDCLSQASYLVADQASGVGAVVDPRRDVDLYLDLARDLGVTIRHVLLTHLHADFVAGHLELAARTGAAIHLGAGAVTGYPFSAMRDGDGLDLGAVRLTFLSTPGHTPESTCILVHDRSSGSGRPHAVLTGDTLFVGDVGRPDLAVSAETAAEDLAGWLFDSIHSKLLTLPDDTLVYPGHGAGSLCGRNLGKETVSTIGRERRFNFALQAASRDEFVALVTADQPPAPAYFAHDVAMNRDRRALLDDVVSSALRPLTVAELARAREHGTLVVDTRSPDDFAASHLAGSVFVGLQGRFAEWAGRLLDPKRPLAIVAAPGREAESATRLGRVGFDHIAGVLAGGPAALATAPDRVGRIRRLSPVELRSELAAREPPLVIDLRTAAERAEAAIADSLHLPLEQLPRRLGEIPRNRPVVLHCARGYRSMIGASLVAAAGLPVPADLAGGFEAWRRAWSPGARWNVDPTRTTKEKQMPETTTNNIPRIGDPAPNFSAVTTQGQIEFHKWRGDSWAVLFSHPADFTPVCSTELTEFARRRKEFDQRNAKLIGLSIDSIHSHLAWRENLKQILGVEINFPLIADLDMKVASSYGMLHPGESQTATVRAVFLIDPKGMVRALVYYPLNVGRNVDEVVRLLDALQTSDKNAVACPVNWKPGDKVIVPPPKTEADVAERASHKEYERLDFYLNKKDLL